jgi:RNA polymerase sigma-70 factor (ECF subfamily)
VVRREPFWQAIRWTTGRWQVSGNALAHIDAGEALAHADGLYNFARWLSADATESEDLVQETYVRALASAHQFQPGTRLRAWLFRILRNAFLDRRRRVMPESSAAEADDLGNDASTGTSTGELDQEQVRRLVAADVAAAVRDLPEAFRTVVLLDMEGFTEPECAHVLGCAEGTVKSRLSRARARLRSVLGAYKP